MKKSARITRYTMIALVAFGAIGTNFLFDTALAQGTKEHVVRQKGDRDPFVKWKPPVPVRKEAAGHMTIPTLEARINQYKALKAAAMSSQQPAPKPTTAFLLNEFQVVGIFHTPRGYAAMVEATPIKLSYVIYPGEQFFDGQLVAVEGDKLVFRHETRLTNGKSEMTVITKPLRVATVLNDPLTAKAATTNAPAPEAQKDQPAASGPAATPQQ